MVCCTVSSKVVFLVVLLCVLFSCASGFALLLRVPARSTRIGKMPSRRAGVHVQQAKMEMAMLELPQLALSQSSAIAVPVLLMIMGTVGGVVAGIYALYNLANAVFVQPNMQLLLVKLDGLAEGIKKLDEGNKKLDEKLEGVKGEINQNNRELIAVKTELGILSSHFDKLEQRVWSDATDQRQSQSTPGKQSRDIDGL